MLFFCARKSLLSLSFDPLSSFLFFFFFLATPNARGILVPHLGVKLRPQAGIKSAES